MYVILYPNDVKSEIIFSATKPPCNCTIPGTFSKTTTLGFIIVAVLACAVCLILRLNAQSQDVKTITDGKQEIYNIELSVKNVRVTSVQYFNRGDLFFLEKWTSRMPLGEIVSVQHGDAQSYYADIEGHSVLVPNQSVNEQTKRSDMTLTIEVTGLWNSDGEFLLDGTEHLSVNKEITIVNKYITVYGTILSIKKP